MKIGVVLGGGAALGAFEVGVWKAMCELGMNNDVTCFAGSSIGSINSVAFSALSYDDVEKIWLSITSDIVLAPTEKNIKERIAMVIGDSKRRNVLTYSKSFRNVSKEGIYHREPLAELIGNALDFNEPFRHNIYATITECDITNYDTPIRTSIKSVIQKDFFVGEYVNLRDKERSDVLKLLCASSAIPVVFPPEEYNGKLYLDGGLYDNLPFKPIIENEEVDLIIVVDVLKNHLKRIKIDKPAIRIDLRGIPYDLLTFKKSSLEKKIDVGYKQAMKLFKKNEVLLNKYFS